MLGEKLNDWVLTPSGTEGMRTAEVCVGGVSTAELSSKTMESIGQKGLYALQWYSSENNDASAKVSCE
jgi:predicted flavoprotein YhiN